MASFLPKEIILSILGYLDSTSLCRAAQVSTRWKDLADDHLLWRRMCEEHGYGRKRSDTRPWKVVYRDRMDTERNWHRGRYTTRTLTGHTSGVTCLQFSETLSNPTFPVLISGSFDNTVRVWNMDTGKVLHCLTGHTRCVYALQFDEAKLITGSFDFTLKIWDWRRGECIRTLGGHSRVMLCLHYDENLLASGCMDSTINIWNLTTGSSMFTLEGHSNIVSGVRIWNLNEPTPNGTTANDSLFDTDSTPSDVGCLGMLLFSSSCDGNVRLWDLNARTCLQEIFGHDTPLMSMALLLAGENYLGEKAKETEKTLQREQRQLSAKNPLVPTWKQPVLLLGDQAGTIKLCDARSGKVIRTYSVQGHDYSIAIAIDKTRLLGATSNVIKVWSINSDECLTTLIGHSNWVQCLALDEDKVVSGSLDYTIKIWSFVTAPESYGPDEANA